MRVFAAILVFAFAPCLTAQTSTGSLNGYALDSSSAAIAGARIVVREVATGVTRTATTDDRGQFVFPSLLPGTYELSAEAAGFKRAVRSNIVIEVQQTARVDPVLEVGNVSETVEVKAEIPLLQPSTSSLGQVVDNQKIIDLPLDGRNAVELVALTAGVQPLEGFGGVVATGNAYAQGNVSIGGGGGFSSSVLLDGANANSTLFNAPAFVPSVDTIGEFKVQTSAFSAEFGRTAGGVVNVAMKSGTNKYHGGIFEFMRNRVLDANTFFNNTVGASTPKFTYNMFGGTLGGPVQVPKLYQGRDRTFFFVAYEGFRERKGLSPIWTVPTVIQQQGDFSQTRNQNGQMIAVYDPLTVHLMDTGRYNRDPFPGNRVPRDRFDPVAAKAITFYPAPNLPGDPVTGTRNYIGNAPVGNVCDQVNVRIDQSLHSSHRLFGRYSLNRADRGAAALFGEGKPFGNVNPNGGNVPILVKAQQFALRDTVTASPTTLVDLSYSVVRQFINKVPASWGKPLTDLGFSKRFSDLSPLYYPNFSITNYQMLQGSNGDLIRRGDYTHTFQGSVTRLAGRNTFKTGVEYRLMRASDYQPPAANAFSFNASWTQQDPRSGTYSSANSIAGYSLASFLLGYTASGTAASGPALAVQNHYLAGYLQNDLRLNRRLTLNLGVRYDLETPRTERFNQQNWFDFTVPSPLAATAGIPDLRGGLVFAGVDGNPRRQQVVDTNNISPRVGLAYSLDRNTVIRTGYGIYYLWVIGSGYGTSLSNGGYSASTAMRTTDDSNLTAAALLRDPFPNGISQPRGNADGLATMIGQSLTAVDRGNRAGYAQQYNLNVQRTLPHHVLLDLAYSGSHNIRISGSRESNQLNPANYEMGSTLVQTVPNPFRGIVKYGSMSAPNTSVAQSLRPYRQFLNLTIVRMEGNSNYNSFQAKLERRMASGIGFSASYTASKSIGDANPITVITGTPSSGFQNNYDKRNERALLTQDISQRMVITYSYQLPIGRRLRFGRNWSRALDLAFGDWQINGLGTLQTGQPLIVGLAAANTYGGSRPNSTGRTANLPASERSIDKWFDRSAFTQPPAYSLGNVGRTLPDVRKPGLQSFNLSVFKYFNLTESLKMHFRAEAFNLLNHTNLGGPNATFGSTMFGVITSAGSPRIMQLALKLNF